MCRSCYRTYGWPQPEGQLTFDAAEKVQALYDVDCVGGAAHIVTDDWNIEDEHIDYCLTTADEHWAQESKPLALAALNALKQLPLQQRAAALALCTIPDYRTARQDDEAAGETC